MDAYVLGKHDGELPTHLLGQGDNRIRAMARLEGPDHNVFYALEVPDEGSVHPHTTAIADAGTIIAEILIHNAEVAGFILITIHPSHMPPWERYVFLLLELELEELEQALVEAGEILGPDGVAAAVDGQGRALVELGSNDPAGIEQAMTALGGGAVHAVGAGGIVRG